MGTATPLWLGISKPEPLLPSFLWTCFGAVLGCDLAAGPVPQPGHPDCPSSLSPAEVSHPRGLPQGVPQTLLVQGCCWAPQRCCGLALGLGCRAGGKGTASSQQPQFLPCGFTSPCKHAQEPSEVWGMWGPPPTSPLKGPYANMHHFCQHLCGVPAWGWAPPAPQHQAPHSLPQKVLALHTSDEDRQGTQDDAPCLGAPSQCMG